jgi:CRISPR-associated protein Csh2
LQQPLLLLHVEYADDFFRIGYLEEGLRLEPGRDSAGRDRWLGGSSPTGVGEVTLDVAKLAETLRANAKRIARARVWVDPKLRLAGELPAERGAWPGEAGGPG